MVIPKKCDSRLLTIDYFIGYDSRNTYEEVDCDVKVLDDNGEWKAVVTPYMTASEGAPNTSAG